LIHYLSILRTVSRSYVCLKKMLRPIQCGGRNQMEIADVVQMVTVGMRNDGNVQPANADSLKALQRAEICPISAQIHGDMPAVGC
jgi:hypothetical protein